MRLLRGKITFAEVEIRHRKRVPMSDDEIGQSAERNRQPGKRMMMKPSAEVLKRVSAIFGSNLTLVVPHSMVSTNRTGHFVWMAL
eukprot:scaffold1573_cov173-Amphora_coffeaeformis.AAC.9